MHRQRRRRQPGARTGAQVAVAAAGRRGLGEAGGGAGGDVGGGPAADEGPMSRVSEAGSSAAALLPLLSRAGSRPRRSPLPRRS